MVSGKESVCQCRRGGFDLWDWEDSPGEGNGNFTPGFLPGKSHGQRNLAGYSPWGPKELDMTERGTHTHTHTHTRTHACKLMESKQKRSANQVYLETKTVESPTWSSF